MALSRRAIPIVSSFSQGRKTLGAGHHPGGIAFDGLATAVGAFPLDGP